MKRVLPWCIAVLFSIQAVAQTPVSVYSFNNNTNVPDQSNTGRGWNSSGIYLQSTNYTMHFGRSSSSSNGMEREILGFNVGTRSFSRVNGALTDPFTNIIINRHPGMVGDTINTFYEYTNSSGNNLYMTSEYVPELENIINSNIVNRGSDNLFSNSPTTRANIERVDLVYGNGIYVFEATLQGFLINERGGNDNFKLAAITGINASQTVTSLGNLVAVSASSWGQVGPQIDTRVMSRRLGTDPNLRPKQDVTTQPISGIYVSFADLGIPNGATIYGFALFPNDVTSSMNLISLTNVPTNTNQGSDGGLDLMAGMGYFAENNILPQINWGVQLKRNNNQILLSWGNPFLSNVEEFDVQRSADGVSFQTIGKKGVETNQNILNYTDVSPAISRKLFYRVKAKKTDGSFLYSNVLFTEGISVDVKTYPNPFTQYLMIELLSESHQNMKLRWTNIAGRLVKEETYKLSKGVNAIKADPTSLSGGSYYIQIQMDDGTQKSLQVFKN